MTFFSSWSNPWLVIGPSLSAFFAVVVLVEGVITHARMALAADTAGGDL